MNTGSGEHSPGIGFAGDHHPLMSASVAQKYIVQRLEHDPGFDHFALRPPSTYQDDGVEGGVH